MTGLLILEFFESIVCLRTDTLPPVIFCGMGEKTKPTYFYVYSVLMLVDIVTTNRMSVKIGIK